MRVCIYIYIYIYTHNVKYIDKECGLKKTHRVLKPQEIRKTEHICIIYTCNIRAAYNHYRDDLESMMYLDNTYMCIYVYIHM